MWISLLGAIFIAFYSDRNAPALHWRALGLSTYAARKKCFWLTLARCKGVIFYLATHITTRCLPNITGLISTYQCISCMADVDRRNKDIRRGKETERETGMGRKGVCVVSAETPQPSAWIIQSFFTQGSTPVVLNRRPAGHLFVAPKLLFLNNVFWLGQHMYTGTCLHAKWHTDCWVSYCFTFIFGAVCILTFCWL